MSEDEYKAEVITYIKRVITDEWNSGVNFTEVRNASDFTTAVQVEENDTDIGVAFEFKVEAVDVKALDGPIFWDDQQDELIGDNHFYRIRLESKKGGEFTTDLNVQLLELELAKHVYVKKFIRKSLLKYLSKLDQQVHDIKSTQADIEKFFQLQYSEDNFFFIPAKEEKKQGWGEWLMDKAKSTYKYYIKKPDPDLANKMDRLILRVNCANPRFDPLHIMLTIIFYDEKKIMIDSIDMVIDSLYYQFEYSFNLTTKRVIIKSIESGFRKLQKVILPFFDSWNNSTEQILPGLVSHVTANAEMYNEEKIGGLGGLIEVYDDELPAAPDDYPAVDSPQSPVFIMKLTISNATDEDPDNKIVLTRKFPKISQYTLDLAPTYSMLDFVRLTERINKRTNNSGLYTENFVNPFIEAVMIVDPARTDEINDLGLIETVDETPLSHMITPPTSTVFINHLWDLGLRDKLDIELGVIGMVGDDIIVDYFYKYMDPGWYDILSKKLGW